MSGMSSGDSFVPRREDSQKQERENSFVPRREDWKFFNFGGYLSRKLQFKMPTKGHNIIASERYLFIPIRYQNQEIYLKTPKIVVPFGVNVYIDDHGDKHYQYVISFTDRDIDPNIEVFYQFMSRFEIDCQLRVRQHLEKWCLYQYPNDAPYQFENLNFKSGFKDNDNAPLFRFKITTTGRQVTEVYNETGASQEPDDYEQLISPACQAISLLEPSIWINSTEYGITWKVHQLKVYPSNRPLGGVSLLDETIVVHGIKIVERIEEISLAPPLAPPMAPPMAPPLGLGFPKRPIGGVSMLPFLSTIQGGGFQLKKLDQDDPKFKTKKKSNFPEISLDEILSIKNRLKKAQN